MSAPKNSIPPNKGHKLLIIKLGYSETLTSEQSRTCSLGDVFRTTVILHLFKDCHVTWLTDSSAQPLLKNNPFINRILIFDPISILQLESEEFDIVINLEKIPGICALVGRISAWNHFGFRFDKATGTAKAYEKAYQALEIATREDLKKMNNKSWAEVLFNMLGHEYKNENYILGYKPQSTLKHNIGLNSEVGSKFPVKAWNPKNWAALERLLENKYSSSRQKHLNDLEGYINWINECSILVTNDSLGIYLALAMNKKVIALFGPTPSSEQPKNKNLIIITPPFKKDCMPCCKNTCAYNDPCIDYITPEMVFNTINSISAGGLN
jgi:heptosyltransferase-2